MTAGLPPDAFAISSFGKHDDPFGWRTVFAQAKRDLYGTKDVQDAVTASYVWLADQLGHFALGLIPTLLLCWLWTTIEQIALSGPSGPHDYVHLLGCMAAAIPVAVYWARKERYDFRQSQRNAEGSLFALDSADLRWNIQTALLYFALGETAAVSANISGWVFLVWLTPAIYLALRVIFWWLRRKLAFQQAGLPYLFRLANFKGAISQEDVKAISKFVGLTNLRVRFWRVCFVREIWKPVRIGGQHLLIAGPLGAGKTSLAVGIGTEFGFRLGTGRYLTLAKLVQLQGDTLPDSSASERVDGRTLWSWRRCDLVIVDDVDAGVMTGSTYFNLVQPNDFRNALGITSTTLPPLAWLGKRGSVWIIGDPSTAAQWQTAIAEALGISVKTIKTIALSN